MYMYVLDTAVIEDISLPRAFAPTFLKKESWMKILVSIASSIT